MEIAHPVDQKGPPQHFSFGDITGGSGNAYIGDEDVKIAPVVSNIKDRLIFRDIFLPNDGNIGNCKKKSDAESTLHNGKRTFIFEGHVEFSNDPFND